MNIEDIEKEIEETMEVELFQKQMVKAEAKDEGGQIQEEDSNIEEVWSFFLDKHV